MTGPAVNLVSPVSSAPASSCLPKLESSSSRLAWIASRSATAALTAAAAWSLVITGTVIGIPSPSRHDQVFGRTALAMSTSSIRRLRSEVSRASARYPRSRPKRSERSFGSQPRMRPSPETRAGVRAEP